METVILSPMIELDGPNGENELRALLNVYTDSEMLELADSILDKVKDQTPATEVVRALCHFRLIQLMLAERKFEELIDPDIQSDEEVRDGFEEMLPWLLRVCITNFKKELGDGRAAPLRLREVRRRLRIAEEVFDERLEEYVNEPQIKICADEFEFLSEQLWALKSR